ncbi:hypothetical protein RvY_12270 [Ramazzottius varieornatus]|uniref:Squalene synthase n=1 Tax=Ramazzottius varieornatus TaxID=947166 RepID=A0A1D1VKX9_RAMVA|nr:hypothetical protein RvY_12270 [Ramazzottius varieornatus]
MDLVKSLPHPEEILALLKFKTIGCSTVNTKLNLKKMDPDMRRCFEYLKMTSRSFCAVIMALDEDLRYGVCIYYLVLRALDTVEDDMTIALDTKCALLETFYQKLNVVGWNFNNSKEKDRMVLDNFQIISSEFRKLSPAFQQIISGSCRDMGSGMAQFLKRKVIDSMTEWDEYCHYVAGLVGIGLSRLFVASGLEEPIVGSDERLANSMGLFLQKTNIIRDFQEDTVQDRLFWPREAWIKYGASQKSLLSPSNMHNSVACLNELVTNAIQHIPDVLTYLGRLKNQSVFNFCAIPQMMAIATLERCYNNPDVFRMNVKIRKGEAVLMIGNSTSIELVKEFMDKYCLSIARKVPENDRNASATRVALQAGLRNKGGAVVVHSFLGIPRDGIFYGLILLMGWKYYLWIKDVKPTFLSSFIPRRWAYSLPDSR